MTILLRVRRRWFRILGVSHRYRLANYSARAALATAAGSVRGQFRLIRLDGYNARRNVYV
jgi:hypothetical protein